MTGWIVAAALLLILVFYHFRCVRQRMYMADYILLMFAEPTTYHKWRGAFAIGLLSLDPAFRERRLWLHAQMRSSGYRPPAVGRWSCSGFAALNRHPAQLPHFQKHRGINHPAGSHARVAQWRW